MKALIILIPENFRDEEFNIPRKKLMSSGVSVTVAGLTMNESRGMLGMKAKPDILLENVKLDEYDAIILPGGTGSRKHLFNNKKIHEAVRFYNERGKIVAAICLSGAVLAYAGILEGRKATVYPTPETLAAYRNNNVIYMGEGVYEDENIITASGPEYAEEFAEKILEKLKQKK